MCGLQTHAIEEEVRAVAFIMHSVQICLGNMVNGMQTNRWGKSAWTFLGTIAYDYPERDVPQERKNATRVAIASLQHIVPCPHCRRSLTQFYEELPFEDALTDRRALTAWLYALHNKVNDKLRAQYFAFYDAPLDAPCDVVGACTTSRRGWDELAPSLQCMHAYPRVPWACTHANPSLDEVDAHYGAMRAGCASRAD